MGLIFCLLVPRYWRRYDDKEIGRRHIDTTVLLFQIDDTISAKI